MKKRIAAYLYFFIAGIATECLGFMLLDGSNRLIDVVTHLTPLIPLPGVAAVIAAWMVQAPFLRAARTRSRKGLYRWTALGVIAAHAAYAVLVFWLIVFSGDAGMAMLGAIDIGFMALLFGFLPNLLFGLGFAEVVLGLGRNRPVAGAGAQPMA